MYDSIKTEIKLFVKQKYFFYMMFISYATYLYVQNKNISEIFISSAGKGFFTKQATLIYLFYNQIINLIVIARYIYNSCKSGILQQKIAMNGRKKVLGSYVLCIYIFSVLNYLIMLIIGVTYDISNGLIDNMKNTLCLTLISILIILANATLILTITYIFDKIIIPIIVIASIFLIIPLFTEMIKGRAVMTILNFNINSLLYPFVKHSEGMLSIQYHKYFNFSFSLLYMLFLEVVLLLWFSYLILKGDTDKHIS